MSESLIVASLLYSHNSYPPAESPVPDQSVTRAKKATIAKTWIKLAFTFMSAIISLNNSCKHRVAER